MNTSNTEVPEQLSGFASTLVNKLASPQRSKHWREHARQDLVLAGWQVLRHKADIGLAQHRMLSRSRNLLRDGKSQRPHGLKLESDFSHPANNMAARSILEVASRKDNPAETALVNDYLAHLPEWQRPVIEFRVARYTAKDIATELNISERTVARELQCIRENYKKESE